MKNLIRPAALFIISLFFSTSSWGKEQGAMILSSEKEDSLWNYFPWVWVTGGAIFILFLIAMIRTRQNNIVN